MFQSNERNFWVNYDINLVRPIDHAVRRIPPEEAVEFVRGTRSIFNIMEGLDPDVVFLPERGAGPIDWALQKFSELYRGKDRLKVYLPIGTCVDPKTSREGGLEKLVKKQIVRKLVGDLRKQTDWFYRPLVIDEVQSGATLTSVTHTLAEALMSKDPREQNVPIADTLFVIAVQDSRNGWLIHKKAKGYTSIAHNEKVHIQAFIEELPLFTVDRQVFLNHLLSSSGVEAGHFRLPMVVHNVAAQKLIQNLVEVVTQYTTLEGNPDQYLAGDEYSAKNLLERVDDISIMSWYREIAKIAKRG